MKGSGSYPTNWKSIRWESYVRANWTCEHCGLIFPKLTRHDTVMNANGKPRILTIHHIDGNKSNNDWTNLLACCQVCHLHIQAVWRPGWPLPWPEPPAWLTSRDLPYLVQQELFK